MKYSTLYFKIMNKQERNTIYKEALRIYQDVQEYSCLCPCIEQAALISRSENTSENFPEFYFFKPNSYDNLSDNDRKCDLWWPREDRECRIAVLNACIRWTTPNLYDKVKSCIFKLKQ